MLAISQHAQGGEHCARAPGRAFRAHHGAAPGVRSHQSQESVTETEPPAYSDLYSRDNSQLDRLVVSD